MIIHNSQKVWSLCLGSKAPTFKVIFSNKHAQERAESQINECQVELNKVQAPRYFKCGV